MFSEVTFRQKFAGLSYSWGPVEFFFGGCDLPSEDLPELFPQYKFCFARQVHGQVLVKGDVSQRPEADALWTDQSQVALVVQTADCLPILLASTTHICAVHAGWRGLANPILKSVSCTLSDFQPAMAVIGPHIQRASFEVGADVASQLLASVSNPTPQLSAPANTGKAYVDLNTLARLQLATFFRLPPQVVSCDVDTKTDLRFCSFRRDAASAGRALSFVVLKA